LIALLATIDNFFGFDHSKDFLVHYHEDLGNISLVRNIKIQLVYTSWVKTTEIKSTCAHVLLQLGNKLEHLSFTIKMSLGRNGKTNVPILDRAKDLGGDGHELIGLLADIQCLVTLREPNSVLFA
jgi:hypothetical protein